MANLSDDQFRELIKEFKASTISKDDLQTLLTQLHSPKMNALDQIEFDKKMLAERMRDRMIAQRDKDREKQQANKQEKCTHSIIPPGQGMRSGKDCEKGQGQWCTSGQLNGDGTMSLVCLRCGKTWKWVATAQEIEYIVNSDEGLLYSAPPPRERWVHDCAYCNERIVGTAINEHTLLCLNKHRAQRDEPPVDVAINIG